MRPDSASRVSAARLGPTLFLLGPLAEGATLPAGLPATLHARLMLPGGIAYVASGPADALDRLAAAGVPARLLDGDTTGKVYYFLDAAAGDARGVAEAAGVAVLYAGKGELLVGLQAGDEEPGPRTAAQVGAFCAAHRRFFETGERGIEHPQNPVDERWPVDASNCRRRYWRSYTGGTPDG